MLVFCAILSINCGGYVFSDRHPMHAFSDTPKVNGQVAGGRPLQSSKFNTRNGTHISRSFFFLKGRAHKHTSKQPTYYVNIWLPL